MHGHKPLILLLLSAALASTAVALVSVNTGIKPTFARDLPAATTPQLPTAPTRSALQTVRFTVYDAGIYPQEATVAQGRIVISLVDYTGGTAGLVVARETDVGWEQAGRAGRRGQHWRGREELNLSPGTYRVYDASRPENQATLMVEP